MDKNSIVRTTVRSSSGSSVRGMSSTVPGFPPVYTSPLRVDLMDAASRQHLRDFLQSRFISYQEDENGAPVVAPDNQRPHAPLPAAGNPSTASVRRPARGLVTLRASPDAASLTGLRALCTVSAEGDLTLWGGPDFDMQLLHAPLSSLAASISEDPAQGEMFALACDDAPNVPTVYCFARDPAGRNRWLDILRRRGVQVLTLHPGE